MKAPSPEEAYEFGAALESLGAQIIRGELPDPGDAVALLSKALVAFTDDVEELKPHLLAASRARQDFLVDLAARARLGPRPK